MKIDGVEIISINLENFNETEARNYLNYVRENVAENNPVKKITVTMCEDGKVDVDYFTQGEKFERIRRITGYLVGSMDSWNDAKRSEEHERVKHNVLM